MRQKKERIVDLPVSKTMKSQIEGISKTLAKQID